VATPFDLQTEITSFIRFHATDNPISDPAKIRRERSQTFKSRSGSSSPVPNASLPPTPKAKAQPSSWIAFSKRDSMALERAYQVSGNECFLFNLLLLNQFYSREEM
jgi:hypothetical protein